jgi:chaperonin cofactor prefoldin
MKLKKLQERLRTVELEVASLESEIAQHDAALADFKSVEETVRVSEVVAERRKQLEARVAEWERVSAELEG